MVIAEKVVLVLCLFLGFAWLRSRSRSVNLENQVTPSLLGVFVILPASLIGEKYLFDHFHFGAWTDMFLKALIVSATFPAIGYGFIKTKVPASDEEEIKN